MALLVYAFAPGPLAWLGALAGFILALLNPGLAPLAVAASLPLAPVPRSLGGLDVSAPEAFLLLGVAAAGLRAAWDRARGRPSVVRPRPTAFDAPLAAFVAAALVSLLVSQYLRLSLRELRTLVLEPALFFYLAVWVDGAEHGRPAGRLAGALLCGATAAACLALGQELLGAGTTAVEGVRRAAALYQSPNNLALLLGRALPFALAAALLLSGWRRGLAAAALALLALADLATFSLGGWLGAAAGLAVVLAAQRALRGRRTLLIGLAVALGLGLAAIPLLSVERVASHLDLAGSGTTALRLELWRASLAMLRDHPLLGIGLDNFLYLYRQQYLPPALAAEPNLSHPHNLVLHVWLALGLPGLAAFLWLVGRFLLRARTLLAAAPRPDARWLLLGALGSMADFVVHGLGDNSYFLPDLALAFWLVLALVERLGVPPPADGP